METQQWPAKYQQSVGAAAGPDTATTTADDCLNNGSGDADAAAEDNAATNEDSDAKIDKGAPATLTDDDEKPLNAGISDNAKQRIPLILEHMKSLTNTEKYLLYLKLSQDANVVDPLRQPLNPLGSRSEINRTISWIKTHLEEDPDISLPKQQVYEEYSNYCLQNHIKSLSQADFGKVMKQVYPKVRARRLGTRGHSRYCYSGLRRCVKLIPPILPDLADKPLSTEAPCTRVSLATASWIIVKEWCEQHFSAQFQSLQALAHYLVINYSVGWGTEAADQITAANGTDTKVEAAAKGWGFLEAQEGGGGGTKHREMQIQLQKKIQQKNEVKERKRKLQSPKSDSVGKTTGKKSKRANSTTSRAEASPTALLNSGETSATTSMSSTGTGGSTSTSPTQGKIICDKASDFAHQTASVMQLPDFKSFHKPSDSSAKVAIPRLTAAPPAGNTGTHKTSATLLSPRKPQQHQQHQQQQQQPPQQQGNKNKYKAIQPKPQPCDIASYNPRQPHQGHVDIIRSQGVNNVDRFKEFSGKCSSRGAAAAEDEGGDETPPHIFPLPRARLESISNVDKDAMDEYLGTNNSQHEEELSKYFNAPQTNNAATDQEAKLSQLRLLLEQNGISDCKPANLLNLQNPGLLTGEAAPPSTIDAMTAPPIVTTPYMAPLQTLLEHQTHPGNARRRVSFETPLSEDAPVPPSPNTRRKNFSFTPISPQSPNNNNNNNNNNVSKCSSGNASPFVSPRNTPVPRTKSKIKREPDLYVEIPVKYNMAMSAPASPMLQKLLNSNSKVAYTPDYVNGPLTSVKPEVVDIDPDLTFRSQSVPLSQMSKSSNNFLLDSQFLSTLPGNQPPVVADFNDFDSLQQETATTVGQIIDSLDEQQDNAAIDVFGAAALPDFGMIINNNVPFDLGFNNSTANNEPAAQRCFGRSQSIDVNPGCYDLKSIINPSRSVPSTPLPYVKLCHQPVKNYPSQSSRSYPSTPLLVNETTSSFTYNLNGDCLLNGQPIRTQPDSAGNDEALSYFCVPSSGGATAAPGQDAFGSQFELVENDGGALMDENGVLITESFNGNVAN